MPVHAMQDMEIRLKDISGRSILLRERVTISDKVNQPILCYGHLSQSGWGISGIFFSSGLAESALGSVLTIIGVSVEVSKP